MKKLIVNADDFGYSYGINRGIIEAHTNGIVTATSVMVDSIAAHEITDLKQYPDLSVGLHFVVTDLDSIPAEIERQVTKFVETMGMKPDHLNSHKVYTEDPRLKDHLLQYGADHDIPVRRLSDVKFIDSFFGPHSNGDLSVDQLKRTIDEATEEYNEIMCHVGYSDDYLRKTSSYNDPREQELVSMCSAEIRKYIDEKGLQLINWKQL